LSVDSGGSGSGNVSTALSVYKFMPDEELRTLKVWKGEKDTPIKRGRGARRGLPKEKKWFDGELDN
jgi:hypothetical protein